MSPMTAQGARYVSLSAQSLNASEWSIRIIISGYSGTAQRMHVILITPLHTTSVKGIL